MQQMVQPIMMPVRPAPPMLVPQPMFIPQGGPQGGPPGPPQQMFLQQQQRPGGVLGGGPPGQRMGGPGMPPVPPMGGGGGGSEEPPNKRQKTEDNLIPEDRFIRQNPGRVSFTVNVLSTYPKIEISLNKVDSPQSIFLTFSLAFCL